MLRKVKIFALIVCSALILTGCPPPCSSYVKVNYGEIPDSILNLIPYSDGERVSFQHSNGLVVNYSISRTEEESVEIEEWSCYEVNHKVIKAFLTPDYPIFQISLYITKFDSTYYDYSIGVGSSSVNIPVNTTPWSVDNLFDSVEVNDVLYTNVFKLKAYSYWDESENQIYLDSIYFNFETGILQLIMSNNETYRLCN